MDILDDHDVEIIAQLDYKWESLKNKTILISGGTGFIGQFLIKVIKYRNKFYNENINVISLSRNPKSNEKNITYIKHDITNKIDLNLNIDYIIHLASNTHPVQYAEDPIGTIITNVVGCNNLLQFAAGNNVKRFLLASTVEVYGEGNGSEIDENYLGRIDCNTVRAGYNEAKRVSESLCQAYKAKFGIDFVIARFARCFGPDRKDDSKALAQFIRNAINNKPIVLKSKGNQRLSYCYVADAVSALFKVLFDGKSGEAYNVADDDEGKTLKEYAQLIADELNQNVTYSDFSQIGCSNINSEILNCNKLKSLGWYPQYSVTSGLKNTINIYKQSL